MFNGSSTRYSQPRELYVTVIEANMMPEVVLVVAMQFVCSEDMFGLNTYSNKRVFSQ